MKERAQKVEEKKRKEEEKMAAVEEKKRKEALNRLTPEEFMKKLTLEEGESKLKYSSFDDATGMPTQFHNGEALNKSQLKKANKEFQAQKKKYDKYIKSSSS